MARWLQGYPGVSALHVGALGLVTAEDPEIFDMARATSAVVITKDQDFVMMQERRGAPPQLVWLTCGNLTNRALFQLLAETWPRAVELLRAGEPLIEIGLALPTG